MSAQEKIVWNTLDEIVRRYAAEEWNQARQESSTVRAVGMDECALTTGHQAFATVSIEREPIEIIASLDYRDQETLIQ